MNSKTRLLRHMIPGLCAFLIILRFTVLKTAHTSDFSLGVTVGALLGLSLLSLLWRQQNNTQQ